MKIENIAVDRLIPYARNAKLHSDAQVAAIAASIKEFGFNNPVLIDKDDGIIAGHGRVLAARKLGMTEVPCIRLGHLTETQKRAYIIADNRLAEIGGGWDVEMLALEIEDLRLEDVPLDLIGFDDAALEKLLWEESDGGTEGLTDPDDVPEIKPKPVSRTGDIWLLGRHRLMCGDSTVDSNVEKLLNGGAVDLICTDPPYCSGGFQESGKSSGSVGTAAAHKMMANDVLSTRGYIALLRSAISLLGAPYLYAFTDWRMWIYLFDVVESVGYGVRSMIVWDKGTPGMGRGWRAQHELVLWGCRETPPFDKYASGAGNVMQAKRTGNKHHTTEKPVEIMVNLLKNTPFARVVADPFNGSGTTMIACEQLGKEYRGMELDALYVDVTVRRWQQFTGQQARRESDGALFDELAE